MLNDLWFIIFDTDNVMGEALMNGEEIMELCEQYLMAITTQHRVLVAELEFKSTRKRRVEGRKLIRWGEAKE